MSKFENNTYVMAERLKELRKSKKLSHAGLSESLRNEYDIKISKDVLIAYEAPQHHAREGANNGMSARYLRCLADFYGVSADYLLGFDVPPTPNMDKRAVIEYTGLSEQAINFLRYLNESSNLDTWKGFVYTPISFIDKILSRPTWRGSWLLTMITSFCVACQHRYPKNNISNHINTLEAFDYSSLPEGFTIVEKRDYSDYALHETERYFSKIIRGMADAAEKHLRLEMEAQNGINET